MTHPTRRHTFALALVLATQSRAWADTGAHAMSDELEPHRHDWDWLVGSWNVRHHRLKARLVGNTEWEEFHGTCTMWTTLDGFGNIDDNMLEIPSGTYRAVGVRAFDPATRQWLIWWLDGRNPTSLDPPVRGGFRDGVGEFLADDTLNGRPIKVRFRWSEIAANSARWEQAFSGDSGATSEVNWWMEFSRVS